MPFKIAADESANVKDMFDVNCKEEADGKFVVRAF